MKVILKTNVFPPRVSGDVFKIEDRNGVPLSQHWRRRLAEGAIEIVDEEQEPQTFTAERPTRDPETGSLAEDERLDPEGVLR